jgi:hypothetical protein
MNIITRAEAGLAPPKVKNTKMKLPVGEVWIHHTVTPVTGDPLADWRLVQKVAFNRGFNDISYSYGIHPQGRILEGRGDAVGAHTKGHNEVSYGVVLIGNYENQEPTDAMIDAVQWLMQWFKDNGKVRPSKTYPTGGHRDVHQTACPGIHAYRKLDEMRAPLNLAAPAPEVPVANAPFAAILVHPNGGYLEIGEDGGIFAWGGAPFFGSLGGIALNQPVVGAAWTPDYGGYYLLGKDGGIFAFGNAQHQGNALWQG